MRRFPFRIGAAAAAVTLALGGCVGNTAPQDPAPTSSEAAAVTTTPTPEPTPTEPDINILRVTIDEPGARLFHVEGDACTGETSNGERLYILYSATDGSTAELPIQAVEGSFREDEDRCRIVYDIEGPEVGNPDTVRLMLDGRDGTQAISAAGFYHADFGNVDSTLTFDITEAELTAAGVDVPEPQADREVALRDALEAAGEDDVSDLDIRMAWSTCEEIEGRDGPNQLRYLIEERKTDKEDQLAVEHLCPELSGLMAEALTGFNDGVHRVTTEPGDEGAFVNEPIRPGRFRTVMEARDCYWERATGGGDTIANDFITAATDGVTVQVYEGETFISERCGPWLPVD